MKRWAWIAVLAAGVGVAAQDAPEIEPEDPNETPFATEDVERTEVAEDDRVIDMTDRIAVGKPDKPVVGVRITEGGDLAVKKGDRWRTASLLVLKARLREETHLFRYHERKKGRRGYDQLPNGSRASRLSLSIAAHEQTPWQNIQFVMTVAADARFYKLEFAVGEKRMLVYRPAVLDFGLSPEPLEPPRITTATVHILARKEKPAQWGGREVNRPTEFVYRCGKEEFAKRADLVAYLKRARKAAAENDVKLVGEIKASPKTPFAEVFAVLETFHAAKVRELSIPDTVIPRMDRMPTTLPYPGSEGR